MNTLESLQEDIKKMSKMKDLSSIKKGDRVILIEYSYRYCNIVATLVIVSSVSKTGRVTVGQGVVFKSDGMQYGGGDWGPTKYLVEYNNENIELVKIYNSMIRMSRYIASELKPDKLDFETMKTVWLITQEQDCKASLENGEQEKETEK